MSTQAEHEMLLSIITHPDNFNSYMGSYKVVRTYGVMGGVDVCLESPCGYYNEVVTVTLLDVAFHLNNTLGERITKLEEKFNDS